MNHESRPDAEFFSDLLEDNDRPYIWNQVSVAHAKGASRKAALEAGRRLMAERAEWLEEGIEICITLRSALEWQPEEE